MTTKGSYDPGAVGAELTYYRGIVEQLVSVGIVNKEVLQGSGASASFTLSGCGTTEEIIESATEEFRCFSYPKWERGDSKDLELRRVIREAINSACSLLQQRGIGEAATPTTKGKQREETGNRFRKKPVVIEAIQVEPVTSSRSHLDVLRDFMGGEERRNIDFGINYSTGEVTINTLEGSMKARVGDWIIKGVKGEFYPCKPDIFAATYVPLIPSGAIHSTAPKETKSSVVAVICSQNRNLSL